MGSSRRERVFLVRLWATSAAPNAEWRGSVQDIAEGRTFYVAGPREVADYLALALAERWSEGDGRTEMEKPPPR